MNPRIPLLEQFKKSGKVVSLEEYIRGQDGGLSEADFTRTDPLEDLHGLTPEQARTLIDHYGEGFLFDKEIEERVRNYFVVKGRIEEIEKARGAR